MQEKLAILFAEMKVMQPRESHLNVIFAGRSAYLWNYAPIVDASVSACAHISLQMMNFVGLVFIAVKLVDKLSAYAA